MPRFQLGAHTFGFAWREDAAGAIEQLADAGFTQFEILAMAPHVDLSSNFAALSARIRRAVEACRGSIVSVDLPSSEANLASSSRDVVDFAVAIHLKIIEFSNDVGAEGITLNTGRRHGLLAPSDSRLVDVYRGALDRIAAAAERQNMKVFLENVPGMQLEDGGSLDDFLTRYPYSNVSVLYDVANAAAVDEDPSAGIAKLASRMSILHLSDAPAGKWRHDPVGTGNIDFAAILLALEKVSFGGRVVVEVISSNPLADTVESKKRLAACGWSFD